jgi:hypothetical protein
MNKSLFLLLVFACVTFGKLSCNLLVNNGPEEIKISCTAPSSIDRIFGTRDTKSSAKTAHLVSFFIDTKMNAVFYMLFSTDSDLYVSRQEYEEQCTTCTVITPPNQVSDRREYTFSINNIAMEGNIQGVPSKFEQLRLNIT